MKKCILYILFITYFCSLYAQDTSTGCSHYFGPQYIMNEKAHSITLPAGKEAMFQLTFYEDFYYRIAVCASKKDVILQYTINDSKNNILFSNKNYDYSPYWNLKFKSTIECIVKVKVIEGATDKEKVTINLLSGYKTK